MQKENLTKKVLICEDDDGILGLCQMVLTDAGYNVVTLDDSNRVFDVISQENPDLIIVDLWMSGLSGDQIVTKLKKDKELKLIPVIIFSANNDIATISKDVGADGFLAKPFPIADLEAIVAKHLN